MPEAQTSRPWPLTSVGRSILFHLNLHTLPSTVWRSSCHMSHLILFCLIRGTMQDGGPAFVRKGCLRSSLAAALWAGSRTNILSRKPLSRGETWEKKRGERELMILICSFYCSLAQNGEMTVLWINHTKCTQSTSWLCLTNLVVVKSENVSRELWKWVFTGMSFVSSHTVHRLTYWDLFSDAWRWRLKITFLSCERIWTEGSVTETETQTSLTEETNLEISILVSLLVWLWIELGNGIRYVTRQLRNLTIAESQK